MKIIIEALIKKHGKLLRYLISGGSAAVVNLGLLFVLTEFVFTNFDNYGYVISSDIAVAVAFFVSFVLQKFWTFAEKSIHLVKKQLAMYFVVGVVNLGINTLMMHGLVEYVLGKKHYMIAQIITSGLIAVMSFFVYQHLIFRHPLDPLTPENSRS